MSRKTKASGKARGSSSKSRRRAKKQNSVSLTRVWLRNMSVFEVLKCMGLLDKRQPTEFDYCRQRNPVTKERKSVWLAQWSRASGRGTREIEEPQAEFR